MEISNYIEYQVKLNKKCTPVLHFILSFDATSYKKLQHSATNSFICCCFASAFAYADIIF